MHFKTAVIEGGILLAGFDYCGKPVNLLNRDSLTDWQMVVEYAQGADEVTGIVLVSLKEANFCAGADLDQIRAAQRSREFGEIDRLVTAVHQLFDSMARSPKPFVAAVEGPCLGGGLELALACHVRIASTHPKTTFALPEVRLGILPGFGGTQRLPRVIGLPAALEMISSGKTIYPRQALRMGLVDGMVASVPSHVRTLEAVQKEALIRAAVEQARALCSTTAHRRRLGISQRMLLLPGVRSVLCRYARRQVTRRVGDFYPAPLRAIEAVERGIRLPVLRGSMEVEKSVLLELMAGSVSAHLVGLFLNGEALKRNVPSTAMVPSRAGVLGAGLMGSQIAGQLAEKGSKVLLRDVSPEILAKAVGRIHEAQATQVRKRIIPPSEVRYRLMRVIPTIQAKDLHTVPLVIEAVSERLDIKRAVLAEFESIGQSDAVFATNTSSHTVAEIAADASHPERCVGLHFFNPVARMQLVEVVHAPFTSEGTLAQACGLAKWLGKIPLVVKDGPGFLVNRILCRYVAEAIILVGEGISIGRIDRIAKDFGMAIDSGHPMGPLELLDLVGLPVAMQVLNALTVLGPRIESRHMLLQSLCPAGKQPLSFWSSGTENPKAVEAIAQYRRAHPEPDEPMSDDLIHKRLFLPMVDEAVRCLHDHVVDHAWQIDVALTHGIGFPAFRGGLLTWARQALGPGRIVQDLGALAAQYGKRFEPCEYVSDELSHGPE